MARRAMLCVAMFVAVTVAWAQPRVLRPAGQPTGKPTVRPTRRPPTRPTQKPTPQMSSVQNRFRQLLITKNVPSDRQKSVQDQFNGLPEGMQEAVLEAMDDQYAGHPHSVPLEKTRFGPVTKRVYVPRIDGFYPPYGAPPGDFAIATGALLLTGNKIVWDGRELVTYPFGPGADLFPNSLGFVVPTTTPLGTFHGVVARRSATR